jgi:haloalkane dehalogenase
MWSFRGDPGMERKARLASGWLGRWMYRRLNASLRLLMPSAYGTRKKLTPAIHQQYFAPFPDPDSRERVLWALARALLGSADHYQRLWDGRSGLDGLPALVIWGRKDSAFPPHYLKRWQEALPTAEVVELETAGHWPHEEEPALVVDAMRRFLSENRG